MLPAKPSCFCTWYTGRFPQRSRQTNALRCNRQERSHVTGENECRSTSTHRVPHKAALRVRTAPIIVARNFSRSFLVVALWTRKTCSRDRRLLVWFCYEWVEASAYEKVIPDSSETGHSGEQAFIPSEIMSQIRQVVEQSRLWKCRRRQALFDHAAACTRWRAATRHHGRSVVGGVGRSGTLGRRYRRFGFIFFRYVNIDRCTRIENLVNELGYYGPC